MNNLPEDLTDFYILHEGISVILQEDIEEIDYSEIKDIQKNIPKRLAQVFI